MTIKDLINNSPLPRPETELLLAFLFDKSREYILTHPEIEISPERNRRLASLVKKRQAEYSIAYLVGQKEFYGLGLAVNSRTLVPRPETEMIVDLILADLAAAPRPVQIVDLGTGSGAIIISLAYEIKKHWPDLFVAGRFLGTDISAGALKIARQNAEKYGLAARADGTGLSFRRGNLWSAVAGIKTVTGGKTGARLDYPAVSPTGAPLDLIITANLPYLTPTQIKNAPSIQKEPRLALDGGRDGLKYYRELFKQLKKYFKTKPRDVKKRRETPSLNIAIYCEIDPAQTAGFKRLAVSLLPNAKIKIYKDIGKNNRLVKISRSN